MYRVFLYTLAYPAVLSRSSLENRFTPPPADGSHLVGGESYVLNRYSRIPVAQPQVPVAQPQEYE